MKGEGMDKVRDALVELEDVINAEGFGCACMPDVKCATCKARDLMSKWVRPSFEKLREALSAQPAGPTLVVRHIGKLPPRTFPDDDLQPAPSVPAVPEFCCEHAWSAAKQLALKERDLSCDCDHNEYCQKCFPLEFRAGGKWDKYAAAPHPAAKGGAE